MPTSIKKTILSKGYFPKELPPAFSTDSFATFATSAVGKKALNGYKPVDQFTECCELKLARPGDESRDFKIPHPYHFHKLADLCVQNFSRLLRLAGRSPFASSLPIYDPEHSRSIRPRTLYGNLPRDKSLARAGCSHLLRADVSHFYPSLYTHAVGWAVDPKLRQKKNWGNTKLLGKKIDQILMDMDKKFSQGIPIGNDLSFLLAEVVLSAVDRSLSTDARHSYRYYDDYEFSFSSEAEANAAKEELEGQLAKFRLRLNLRKTEIVRLPTSIQRQWRDSLLSASKWNLNQGKEMVRYFDTAFRLREESPLDAVLAFSFGVLFKIARPSEPSGRIAESAVTQALLCEPGSSQKALSLLAYWKLNGFRLDAHLIGEAFSRVVARSERRGTHDLTWVLAFCIDNDIALDDEASAKLKDIDNDLIALQSMHMHRKGLLTKDFDLRRSANRMRNAELDREHWLLRYESARHGFSKSARAAVHANPLFATMLRAGVTFYQPQVSPLSYVIAPGCAPDWLVRSWLSEAQKQPPSDTDKLPKDLRRLIEASLSSEDAAQISPGQFSAFFRLHDLNREAEPADEEETYG